MADVDREPGVDQGPVLELRERRVQGARQRVEIAIADQFEPGIEMAGRDCPHDRREVFEGGQREPGRPAAETRPQPGRESGRDREHHRHRGQGAVEVVEREELQHQVTRIAQGCTHREVELAVDRDALGRRTA